LEFYSQTMAAPEAKQYLHDARAPEDLLRPLNLEAATS
jgi:hypothetical protein